jgi:hypothetical protein
MKLELYRNGELYMVIEAVGQDIGDFTIIPKSIIQGSSLSHSSFEELFFKCTRETKTYVEAYEKAEQIHEEYFDKRRYASYDSFRTVTNKK